MKVYVINLGKNTERMAFVDAQLKRMSVDHERISAVDGRTLPQEERRTAFGAFRCGVRWCGRLHRRRSGVR